MVLRKIKLWDFIVAKCVSNSGTGLIGRLLWKCSKESECKSCSLDKPSDISKKVKFENIDLRNFDNCLRVCENQDVVLVGVKAHQK